MKTDKLNEWVSLTANIGVLVGIVFLSIEISQSNRIALGNSEADLRINAMEFVRGISQNDDTALILSKLNTPGPELSPTEMIKAQAIGIEFINLARSAEVLHLHGLITTETFNTYLNEITIYMNNFPGIVPIFVSFASLRVGGSNTAVFEHILSESKSRGY